MKDTAIQREKSVVSKGLFLEIVFYVLETFIRRAEKEDDYYFLLNARGFKIKLKRESNSMLITRGY